MRNFPIRPIATLLFLTGALASTARVSAQSQPQASARSAATPAGMAVPSDYVIGPEDVIGVLFWRDQEMSGDVTVRPDGMITLQLMGELRAAGLQPEALREQVEKAAGKYLAEPIVTVVVRQINSRKVFITGQVARPGVFPLSGSLTVMQLIALAGGLTEYAEANSIRIIRTENGHQRSYKFHYKGVAQGKSSLTQNLQLMPGDTVVVP